MLTSLLRAMGRSPRERGSPPVALSSLDRRGSIPARAGEPRPTTQRVVCCRVDPRASGGATREPAPEPRNEGRSPRERGSRERVGAVEHIPGSIPARAGEPRSSRAVSFPTEVDPRASGGAGGTGSPPAPGRGRSPRERGSRRRPSEAHLERGSIPARAGEPAPRSTRTTWRWVDPRASGGAPGRRASRRGAWGSIPARAGEPWISETQYEPSRVDPRASGGAPSGFLSALGTKGRSPRERGEPASSCARTHASRVDPRASGGASTLALPRHDLRGRSPRERGSPQLPDASADGQWSIPARAGEPLRRGGLPAVIGVDPRASGGALPGRPASRAYAGRSPRERGSRTSILRVDSPPGSIPARAGEPRRVGERGTSPRVDPRASGGASDSARVGPSTRGRSPRERGSPRRRKRRSIGRGSIPARAGEPS